MTTHRTNADTLTMEHRPPGRSGRRTLRNQLAEAFICGINVGASTPDIAGDGDDMYTAFRQWAGARCDHSNQCVARIHEHLCMAATRAASKPSANTGRPVEHQHANTAVPHNSGDDAEFVSDQPTQQHTAAAS